MKRNKIQPIKKLYEKYKIKNKIHLIIPMLLLIRVKIIKVIMIIIVVVLVVTNRKDAAKDPEAQQSYST